jgi:hypothetical protein
MAVLGPDAPPGRNNGTASSDQTRYVDPDGRGAVPPTVDRSIRVEPLIDLEWSRAVEPTGPIGAARRPSQVRRAWIHRAPESQVVSLYRAARGVVGNMAAPWWLRALAAGGLSTRMGGFAVEDQVSELLAPRPGWFYVPWTGPGEDGYWEYVPSDESASGRPLVPTTLVFTDRHSGWLDVVPAHAEGSVDPIPVRGPADLRRRLPEIEATAL